MMFNKSKLVLAYHRNYGLQSPIQCSRLKFVALFYLLAFLLSLTLNTAVILSLKAKIKNRLSSFATLIFALCSINIFGSFIQYPIVIVSNYNCRWLFSKIGCELSAFLMYFIGCTSLHLMAGISFERYYFFKSPTSIRKLKPFTTRLIIGACVFVSLIWATFPLIGWSHYSLERSLTSCSIEWAENSFNVRSYNIAVFLFVFIGPFVLISFSNLMLLKKIKNLPKFKSIAQTDTRRNINTKRIQFEKKLTISAVYMIITFLIAWFPYGLISMYHTFASSQITRIDPLIAILPTLFAKSSMFWPAGFYLIINKRIKHSMNRNVIQMSNPVLTNVKTT